MTKNQTVPPPSESTRSRAEEPLIPRSTLDNLLMQAPALICVLKGPEHVFEMVNPLGQQLFANRNLIGQTVRDALPELHGKPYFELLDRVFRTGEAVARNEQKALIDRAGDGSPEERSFNFMCQPIRNSEGTIDGILVFAFDVTELVHARGRAQSLAASLHRANREKDDFIAAISHELRTPLTSILGWARMLKLGGLDEETFAAALDSIVRGTESQAQLIDDLLDESRISAGKLRLSVRSLRIEDVVLAAVDTVRPAAERQGVILETTIAHEPMIVSGDPGRLQQIVNNLLSNAIKFTPKGQRISVTLGQKPGFASIAVSDSGRGISADFLPNVFHRFRHESSSSDRRDGLGLGLSIVRHLVQLHGGTVEAASEGLGKGATFTVELPLLDSIGKVGSLNDRDGEDRNVALPSLEGLKVLVVEDENDIKNVLQAVLLRCGAEVTSATTADEGLAIVASWKPDVILSDILIPGRDGCAMIEEVRRLSEAEGGKTPAMALSVHGRPNDRERALEAGFSIFKQKPIEPVDLAFDIARLARRE